MAPAPCNWREATHSSERTIHSTAQNKPLDEKEGFHFQQKSSRKHLLVLAQSLGVARTHISASVSYFPSGLQYCSCSSRHHTPIQGVKKTQTHQSSLSFFIGKEAAFPETHGSFGFMTSRWHHCVAPGYEQGYRSPIWVYSFPAPCHSSSEWGEQQRGYNRLRVEPASHSSPGTPALLFSAGGVNVDPTATGLPAFPLLFCRPQDHHDPPLEDSCCQRPLNINKERPRA